MTEKRKEELLARVLRGFAECSDGVETYRFLHDDFGITNEELVECGLDRLRKHFRYEWAEGTPRENMQICSTGCSLRPTCIPRLCGWDLQRRLRTGRSHPLSRKRTRWVAAFREISKRLSPRAVETVYQADPCASQCAVK